MDKDQDGQEKSGLRKIEFNLNTGQNEDYSERAVIKKTSDQIEQRAEQSVINKTLNQYDQYSNTPLINTTSGQNDNRSSEEESSYDDLEEPSLDNLIDLCSFLPEKNKTSNQNDNRFFDVSKFVPKGVKVEFTEKGGSLFIAHTINEFAIKVLRRKTDLVVFQCMLRFTLGFRRPVCKLSYTFISKWTGIKPPNIRRGISNLLDMELIKIAIPHSSKSLTATIYEVPMVREYLAWLKKKESKKQDLLSNCIPPTNQSDNEPIINAITKKENPKEKLETHSQQQSLPHKIEAYFSELKPHSKRVGEEHFFNQLLMDYKPQDIADALDWVQEKGTVDSNEPVHSPMKYLSYTIETVLRTTREQQERRERADTAKREAEEKIAREERKRKEEAELYRKAIGEFESKLTEDEQNDYLNSYYQENYGGNSMIPKGMVREFAVREWYRKENGIAH